ncbi:MAG: hypothetical protein ACFFBL_02030 [Promethearchaeota archaeon]
MESSADDEEFYHSHANLKPSEPDPHQKYVFLAHIVLGVAISILSFSGGPYSWFVGTGLLTPLLLAVTSFFYSSLVGMNWYREELLPYMRRNFMVQEFELERFLKYKRIHHFGALIAGYISTGVCQVVWFSIAPIVVTFVENISEASEVVLWAVMGMIILFLLVMGLIVLVALRPIEIAFSDIKHLIEFDNEVEKSLKAKVEEEKEKKAKEEQVKNQ